METSDKIDKIFPALIKVQAELSPVHKSSKNDHYNHDYAKIEVLQEAVRPIMAANQMAVVQSPKPSEVGVMALETMFIHESGQWMRETATVPFQRHDPQTYCGAVTYARRYSLASMLNITCDNDDDGNTASRPGNSSMPPKASQTQAQQSPELDI